MGFKLRREVRDHLPPGLLTANERCVVLELADYCNDDTRTGAPGVDWLARAADVPAGKVGEILARVARKWTELRVPLGVGSDGRAYYSRTGQRTSYRFPDLAGSPEAPRNGGPAEDGEAPRNGGPEVPRNGGPEVPQNRGPASAGRSPKTGGPSPHHPQRDPSSLSPGERDAPSIAHQVLTAAGADPAEADRLIPVIEHIGKVRTPAAWWRAIAAASDGAQVLDAGRRAIADLGRLDRPGGRPLYRNQDDQAYLDWVGQDPQGSEAAA